MYKIRIIPTLLFNDQTLVKGKQFNSWRVIANLFHMIKLYSLREVDELIFLDINANKRGNINFSLIDEFADECFMPLTVGGGIKNLNDIENLLKAGADKVSINTATIDNPKFIKEAVKQFGSQCIIISIDYKNIDNQKIIFSNSGKVKTKYYLEDYVKKVEDLNPGEILLTSIDHDGMMEGFDIKTIKKINEQIKIPIIAAGGAGKCKDFADLINESKVKAIASASIYHFTEITPLEVKKYIQKKGFKTRI